MKLFIQIPCWNEEKNIAETLKTLPTVIDGIDEIRHIVIDDGSYDKTVAVATKGGAHVVQLYRHKGLAQAFSAGIEYALEHGADIVVNTDGDLQYPSNRIKDLIKPIIQNRADIVVGDRLSYKPAPFNTFKMLLEHLGSFVVRVVSGTNVKDAASGFRAFGGEAIRKMIIHDRFSYTLESLLLAGMQGFRVENITIAINEQKRDSRLFTSIRHYLIRSGTTIFRAYLMYHPVKFFFTIAFLFLFPSVLIGIRFIYFFITSGGAGHIQSLILFSVLFLMGILSLVVGLIGDVVAANRRLLEQIRIQQLNTLNKDQGGSL